MLRPLVGAWFQDLFHPPLGVLFTFPSRYLFAIGLTGVFSLAGWARRIQTGLLVSRPTQDSATPHEASGKGLSPAAAGLSSPFPSPPTYDDAVLLPRRRLDASGLGCSPVARRYWGNHSYFLFLRVLRCFSSPRWPPDKRDVRHKRTGCPIRRSAGQGSFAPHRGFSQLIASFVASVSQGIRHAPFYSSSGQDTPKSAPGRKPYSFHVFTVFTVSLVPECQRSYVPKTGRVENNGLEPLTPCLQGRRSSQLS